ncbi:Nitrogen permease regulator 3 [Malassezia sp. CBS 17886]|nr:Nitrogen permease regulator 3 [Malassezia sp. CBS 17886]
MSSAMASPLVAMLLVIGSSRGAQVAFQWPRHPHRVKRHRRARYYTEETADMDGFVMDASVRHADDNGADVSDGVSSESSAATSSSEASFRNGAAALTRDDDEPRSPRSAVPPALRGERFRSARSRSASRPAARTVYTERTDVRQDEARRLRGYSSYLGFDTEVLAAMLSPKREQCHHKFELIVNDLVFLGHPVCAENQDARHAGGGVSSFNLVLVIDRPDSLPPLPGLDLPTWMNMFYTILFKITSILYSEERRCLFVTDEATAMLALREQCVRDESSLARILCDVHESITHKRDALLIVNNTIICRIQLPMLLQQPAKTACAAEVQGTLDLNDPVFQRGDAPEPREPLRAHSIAADAVSGSEKTLQEWVRTTGPFLLPWKTLLMPLDVDVLVNSDTHSGIVEFARPMLECFQPTLRGGLTFLQTAEKLGLDLYREVYPTTRHLIYYGRARVVDVPRIQNSYVMDPTFDMRSLPALSAEWAQMFPMMRCLPQFLADLSMSRKPFIAYFAPRINHQLCLDVLVWLLRRTVLVQLHIYVRFLVTAKDQERAAELRRERRERRARRAARALVSRGDASDTDSDGEQILIDKLNRQMHLGVRVPDRPRNMMYAAPSRSRSSSSSISSPDEGLNTMRPLTRSFSPSHGAGLGSTPRSAGGDDPEHDADDTRTDDIIAEGGPHPVVIVEPCRADGRESEWISAMLSESHPWYTRWLLRLLPYLNGKHSLDEIIAREHIRRRDLKQVLSHFDANLILFHHP